MPAPDKQVNLVNDGRIILGFGVLDLSNESEYVQLLGKILRENHFFLARTFEDGVYTTIWKGKRDTIKLALQLTYHSALPKEQWPGAVQEYVHAAFEAITRLKKPF